MSRLSLERGRIEEISLTRSICFNSCNVSKALIEIDHINHGLGKTGKLNKSKRTSFTVRDIEKFIMMLDQEHIMPRKYKGSKLLFDIRIDCPVRGRFFQREFVMVFDIDHGQSDIIHIITIYPSW